MHYLEYVVKCPEYEEDIPVAVLGTRKNRVTCCHCYENYFTLNGRILKGSKKQIEAEVTALYQKGE